MDTDFDVEGWTDLSRRLLSKRSDQMRQNPIHRAYDMAFAMTVNDGFLPWRYHGGGFSRVVCYGGICYLDEIVEARKDTTVVFYLLADNCCVLLIEKIGKLLVAADEFVWYLSYNTW